MSHPALYIRLMGEWERLNASRSSSQDHVRRIRIGLIVLRLERGRRVQQAF
jgi:hypothetical protein